MCAFPSALHDIPGLIASWPPRDTSWQGDDPVQVKFFTNLADRQLGLERFPEIMINLENCGESVADIFKVSPRRFARQAKAAER
jgi:hypothetical protein